ncbi:hypothetical protein HYC85_015070 [Camellia sinensis]|uniref:Uncharacterized protein n=1 Tax=Camellia sinensis TaxID=4442 RepID=A0A7J7H844_CAMSI|nr:hypothetical protein HYC85_015070 [Camellia sinensis]
MCNSSFVGSQQNPATFVHSENYITGGVGVAFRRAVYLIRNLEAVAPIFNQHLAIVSFNHIGSLLHWIEHSITTTQSTHKDISSFCKDLRLGDGSSLFNALWA